MRASDAVAKVAECAAEGVLRGGLAVENFGEVVGDEKEGMRL